MLEAKGKIRNKNNKNKKKKKISSLIRREIVHYISVRQETSRQWISVRNPNAKEWTRIKDRLVKEGQVANKTEEA